MTFLFGVILTFSLPLTIFAGNEECDAECGAPEVNWQTAPDGVAPGPGWEVSGFAEYNVGDQRQCGGGWNAFAQTKEKGSWAQGTLSTKMKGVGSVTIQYRDCWKEGSVTVYLNGVQKGQTGDHTGEIVTTTIRFRDGDVLSVKDTGGNGVIQILSTTYQCGAEAFPEFECGTPPLNWQTAPDGVAPGPGWEVSGFAEYNVGDQRQCGGGWNAFAQTKEKGSWAQGTLSAELIGWGILTIQYRDCWKEGSVTVYLNGEQKGQTGDHTGEIVTTDIPFNDGDVLSVKDTGGNGVIQILSTKYECVF